MKKFLTLTTSVMLLFVTAGCEQVDQAKTEADRLYEEGSKQVENVSNEAMKAKEAAEEKARQAQDAAEKVGEAADAINKLSE